MYRARISYLPLSRDTVDSGSDKDSAAATLTGVDNEVNKTLFDTNYIDVISWHSVPNQKVLG